MTTRICDSAQLRFGDPDRLVVMCSARVAGVRDAYDYAAFSERLPYTALMIRDLDAEMTYHTGLAGLGDDIESTAEFLREFIAEMNPRRTTFFGTSSGGYAAILFGHLVGADDILTTSPVTFVDPDVRDRLGGGERFEGVFDKIADHYRSRDEVPRYLDLNAVIREHGDNVGVTRVYYPASDEIDAIQASNIAGLPRVQTFDRPTGRHATLGHILIRRGVLQQDLETSVADLLQDGAGAAPG